MEKNILKISLVFLFIVCLLLLIPAPPLVSARPQPERSDKGANNNGNNNGYPGGMGGPFGQGSGIPGVDYQPWGSGFGGGGYGYGFGGPTGGYSRGGVIRPTVVCKQTGPCYKKKLTCPAKCFTSYSRSGKGYGAGGGSGGCTVDCEKYCVAYC